MTTITLTTPQRIALDAIAFNPGTRANSRVLLRLQDFGLIEPHPILQPCPDWCAGKRRFFAGGPNFARLTDAGRTFLNIGA